MTLDQKLNPVPCERTSMATPFDDHEPLVSRKGTKWDADTPEVIKGERDVESDDNDNRGIHISGCESNHGDSTTETPRKSKNPCSDGYLT